MNLLSASQEPSSENCKELESFSIGGKLSLNSYLQTLKLCNHEDFKTECYLKSYNLTPYYHLVYLLNCDTDLYNDICVTKNDNQTFYDLTNQRLIKTCSSVESVNNPTYHEKLYENIPFCTPFSCGGTDHKLTKSYNCMNDQCFVSTVIFSAIDYTLILLIAIANVLTIRSTLQARRSKSEDFVPSIDLSQSMVDYFKISLATTDLVIGIIVFPSLVYLKIRYHELGSLNRHSPKVFLNITGFFTIFAYSAQFMTLMLAGLDRILVLSRPVAYISGSFKKRFSLNMTIAWGVSFLLAVFPLLTVKGYSINRRLLGLVISDHKGSLFVYLTGLCLPLITTVLLALVTQYKLSEKQKVELKAQQLNVKVSGLNGLLPTKKEIDFARAYVYRLYGQK